MTYTTHNTDLVLAGMLALVILALLFRRAWLRARALKRRNQTRIVHGTITADSIVTATATPSWTFQDSRGRPMTRLNQLIKIKTVMVPLDHQRDWPGWLD